MPLKEAGEHGRKEAGERFLGRKMGHRGMCRDSITRSRVGNPPHDNLQD